MQYPLMLFFVFIGTTLFFTELFATSAASIEAMFQQNNILIVHYFTRMPPDAWKTNIEHHFTRQKNTLTLKAIRLLLPFEAKVCIGGLQR